MCSLSRYVEDAPTVTFRLFRVLRFGDNFPIAFGYLDNSTNKFRCASLMKFESHYHLRFELRYACS
jgi:hypothetical protein